MTSFSAYSQVSASVKGYKAYSRDILNNLRVLVQAGKVAEDEARTFQLQAMRDRLQTIARMLKEITNETYNMADADLEKNGCEFRKNLKRVRHLR